MVFQLGKKLSFVPIRSFISCLNFYVTNLCDSLYINAILAAAIDHRLYTKISQPSLPILIGQERLEW